MQAELPSGPGLAAKYPGDAGIEQDADVVFVETFNVENIQAVRDRWTFSRHTDVMALSEDVPAGSASPRSLRMTARPDRQGVELWQAFDEGWDTIHLRFNVKFADDYALNHHFVALRGSAQAERIPMGGAGRRPENSFSVTLEPTRGSRNFYPVRTVAPPPGVWQFYAYWPEMRSWQTPEGDTDGRPNPYYGNTFLPEDPGAVARRGEWMTMEIMLKLNSEPELSDGELALWVDGVLAVHFKPGEPHGYFMRDQFRNDPTHRNAEPFKGFRWRHDEDVKINVLRLQNYVSRGTFNRAARLAEEHPEWNLNTEQATVYFANVVMAKKYIGPMTPAEE